MLEVVAKLCLKNSLDIREVQAEVLYTCVVPRDEKFAAAGLDAARTHMEKVKDAAGNAKKLSMISVPRFLEACDLQHCYGNFSWCHSWRSDDLKTLFENCSVLLLD